MVRSKKIKKMAILVVMLLVVLQVAIILGQAGQSASNYPQTKIKEEDSTVELEELKELSVSPSAVHTDSSVLKYQFQFYRACYWFKMAWFNNSLCFNNILIIHTYHSGAY